MKTYIKSIICGKKKLYCLAERYRWMRWMSVHVPWATLAGFQEDSLEVKHAQVCTIAFEIIPPAPFSTEQQTRHFEPEGRGENNQSSIGKKDIAALHILSRLCKVKAFTSALLEQGGWLCPPDQMAQQLRFAHPPTPQDHHHSLQNRDTSLPGWKLACDFFSALRTSFTPVCQCDCTSQKPWSAKPATWKKALSHNCHDLQHLGL